MDSCSLVVSLASASSDGVIRVWDLRMSMKEKPNPLAEANTKSRLTCLAGSSLNVSTLIAFQMFSALESSLLKRPQMGASCLKEAPDAAEGE
ncbi:hypothetical protein DKX38_019338 [Salix brachista]|uniref:Uncharacterized protein n=1 Tax=Salix brachista TaxID=2182728 RepID=A0A5N5KG04_9ROSI|nr:hypothetical protein DKX38_019338 [Salix brachista]